jgi:hypothetical protein
MYLIILRFQGKEIRPNPLKLRKRQTVLMSWSHRISSIDCLEGLLCLRWGGWPVVQLTEERVLLGYRYAPKQKSCFGCSFLNMQLMLLPCNWGITGACWASRKCARTSYRNPRNITRFCLDILVVPCLRMFCFYWSRPGGRSSSCSLALNFRLKASCLI